MEPHTAGDPISGLRWTHKTTQKISDELRKVAIRVCPKTVGRVLRGLKFSLRVNHKKVAGQSNPYRNQQFEYINRTRARFVRIPVNVTADSGIVTGHSGERDRGRCCAL